MTKDQTGDPSHLNSLLSPSQDREEETGECVHHAAAAAAAAPPGWLGNYPDGEKKRAKRKQTEVKDGLSQKKCLSYVPQKESEHVISAGTSDL